MTTDPCREWRGALGAAVLGGLDPAEEIALRAHLDGCPACRAELRELTAVAGALDAVPVVNVISAPAEPSGALAGRVLARVAQERAARRARRTRRAAVGVGAFGAVAAALVAVLLVVAAGGGSDGTRVTIPGTGGASATALLRERPVGTQIDVTVSGLASDHYYWMWLTGDDDHRIPAGTFRGSPQGAQIRLMAALPLHEARRIWVTDDHDRVVLDAPLPDRA